MIPKKKKNQKKKEKKEKTKKPHPACENLKIVSLKNS